MQVYNHSSDKCFKIDYNSKLGRHLVATRDIEIGELIIDDYPLVLGPSTFVDPNIKYSSTPSSVCLTCYVKLTSTTTTTTPYGIVLLKNENNDDNNSKSEVQVEEHELNNDDDDDEFVTKTFLCPKCGLALCSKICSENNIHVENECKIFQRIPTLLSTLVDNIRDLHQFITTIRCLFYKKRNPIKWKQIKELQARIDELESMGVYDGVNIAFSLLNWKYFDDDDEDEEGGLQNSPPEIIEEEDITHMARHCLGILRTNAFSRFSTKISIECLYFLSSFMSHNCLMNTDRYFDMDGVRLVTRAAIPILKDQPITTTYLSHLNNNIERQREMKSVWNFLCDCSRCLDPTECGTYLSTIVCPSCKCTTLNPHLISNSIENYNWICSNQICSKQILNDNNIEIESHLENTIWIVENNQPDINDVEGTENWLKIYDNQKFLHSNHSLFIQVKLYLCQEYGCGGGMSELTNEQLLRKRVLCNQVIKVLDKLLGGAYLLRGVVLFELWLALQEIRIRCEYDETNLNEDDELIQTTASMAKDILRFGSKNSAEELMFNILNNEENV